MTILPVKITLEHEYAQLPTRATAGSAGYDIYSVDSITIRPGDTTLVNTGLALEIPLGFEAQIRSRSGLALRGLVVANAPGTIDSDFRGEVKVILRNSGSEEIKVNRGDRIAQFVFAKHEPVELRVVKHLNASDRGLRGFGSTGD